MSGTASAGLAEETGASDQALVLAGDEATVGKFPEDGGIVEVDGEKIRYGVRRGAILSEPSRGLDGTRWRCTPQGPPSPCRPPTPGARASRTPVG